MMKEGTPDSAAIWKQLVESHENFTTALQKFFAEGIDRVSVLRSALRGRNRVAAISIARYLHTSELLQLFPELMHLSSFSHGAVQTIRDLIMSLPKDWVLTNIEVVAEPLLNEGSYDEYRRLLELYARIDQNLAVKLANRALNHSDEDINEAGRDFLETLRLKL